jgi:hypothetical protein
MADTRTSVQSSVDYKYNVPGTEDSNALYETNTQI